MSVQVCDHKRIDRKLMDGVRDKACGIWVPIFIGVKTESKLPERLRTFIRIAGSESIESMQIAGKRNKKGGK